MVPHHGKNLAKDADKHASFVRLILLSFAIAKTSRYAKKKANLLIDKSMFGKNKQGSVRK
jgi:hypothetical protein